MNHSEIRRSAVLILSLKGDQETAESIAAYLAGKGLSVSTSDPESTPGSTPPAPGGGWTALVVMLSDAASRSAAFLSAAAGFSHQRIVPVCVTPLADETIPAFLSELNWVLWYAPSSIDKHLSVFIGVNTDLGRYRETKSIEQEARAWQAAARDDDYLIVDMSRIEALKSEHARKGHEGIASYSDLAVDFLEQSYRVSRRGRWRRNSRWAFRVGVAAAVVAVIAAIWPVVQATVASNKLSVVLLADETPGRPDLDAMKLSGLSLFFAEQGVPVPESVGHRIVRALGEPWAVGQIGIEGDLYVSAATFGDAESLVIGDTQGWLGELNLQTGDFGRLQQITQQPIVAIGLAPDSSTIALADRENAVYLTDREGRILWSSEVPSPVKAIRNISSTILVLTNDGVFYTSPGEQGAWVHHPARNVLDAQLSPTSGAHILSRNGSDLVDSDIQGLQRRAWPLAATNFEAASLDPSGRHLVSTGPGSQLWVSIDGSPLHATGLRSPDVVRELVITESGTVIWATDALGAQIFDTTHNVRLGRLCPSSTGAMEALEVDRNMERVVCLNGATATVQGLAERLPLDVEPANSGLSTKRSVEAGTEGPGSENPSPGQDSKTAIEILTDDRVKFSFEGSSEILDPRATSLGVSSKALGSTPDRGSPALFEPGVLWFSGAPTVVSINAAGTTAAVGSSDGTVTELDMHRGGPILASRWVVPGESPITQLGWSPDGRSLVVGTRRGEWYAPPSCAGCGTDLTKMLSEVKRRGWFCYPKEGVELFTEPTLKALNMRQCADPKMKE